MSVNGNLVNTAYLKTFLDQEARRHVNSESDSELLFVYPALRLSLHITNNSHRLNVFAHSLSELGKARANVEDIFTALRDVYSKCHGAFACAAMVAGYGILGFR